MEIYKTTNKKTGEYYIGLNTTSDPNYLGSGVELKKQIEKYGKKNFIKEILCLVTSNSTDENILRKIEHAYILNHIDNKNCLNKSIGYNKAKKTKFNYHKNRYQSLKEDLKMVSQIAGFYKIDGVTPFDGYGNIFIYDGIEYITGADLRVGPVLSLSHTLSVISESRRARTRHIRDYDSTVDTNRVQSKSKSISKR